MKTQCCGYDVPENVAFPVMWNPGNMVVQCHNCGCVYEPKEVFQPVEPIPLDKSEFEFLFETIGPDDDMDFDGSEIVKILETAKDPTSTPSQLLEQMGYWSSAWTNSELDKIDKAMAKLRNGDWR